MLKNNGYKHEDIVVVVELIVERLDYQALHDELSIITSIFLLEYVDKEKHSYLF